MSPNILKFRESCAEDGIELTHGQANKFYKAYVALKEEIQQAVAVFHDFYQKLCNSITQDKLKDLKRMNQAGANMNLKDYNELQATIKKICELEGYNA